LYGYNENLSGIKKEITKVDGGESVMDIKLTTEMFIVWNIRDLEGGHSYLD